MRKNEYKCLDDFINEYNGKHEIGDEFHIGIEFYYKDQLYRMCLEPGGNAYFLYKVLRSMEEHIKTGKDMYKILGVFDSIELLLEATVLDNKKFKKIIMEDDTIIDSKDWWEIIIAISFQNLQNNKFNKIPVNLMNYDMYPVSWTS